MATPRQYAVLGPLAGGVESRAFLGCEVIAGAPSADSPVVIVWLPDEVAKDPRQVSRLQRETAFVTQLRHPNINRIHGLECFEEGWARVLVYEDGEQLSRALAKLRENDRNLEPLHAARIMVDACEAVHFAHEEGLAKYAGRPIVHGGLRPDTLFLTFAGYTQVAAFGAATLPGPQAFAYLAPEQIIGGKATASPSTDTYALGAILYELLAGKAPFADAPDIERAVLTGDPPRIDEPGLSGRLGNIATTAMSKRGSDRFEGVGVMRDAIITALQGEELPTHDVMARFFTGLFPQSSPERMKRKSLLESATDPDSVSMLSRPSKTPSGVDSQLFEASRPAPVSTTSGAIVDPADFGEGLVSPTREEKTAVDVRVRFESNEAPRGATPRSMADELATEAGIDARRRSSDLISTEIVHADEPETPAGSWESMIAQAAQVASHAAKSSSTATTVSSGEAKAPTAATASGEAKAPTAATASGETKAPTAATSPGAHESIMSMPTPAHESILSMQTPAHESILSMPTPAAQSYAQPALHNAPTQKSVPMSPVMPMPQVQPAHLQLGVAQAQPQQAQPMQPHFTQPMQPQQAQPMQPHFTQPMQPQPHYPQGMQPQHGQPMQAPPMHAPSQTHGPRGQQSGVQHSLPQAQHAMAPQALPSFTPPHQHAASAPPANRPPTNGPGATGLRAPAAIPRAPMREESAITNFDRKVGDSSRSVLIVVLLGAAALLGGIFFWTEAPPEVQQSAKEESRHALPKEMVRDALEKAGHDKEPEPQEEAPIEVAVATDPAAASGTAKGETAPVDAPPIPQIGRLVLSTDPEVDVYNGNDLLGRTPLSAKLPSGNQKIRFTDKKTGLNVYKTYKVRAGGEVRDHISFGTSELIIEAPDGASILLNSRFIGTAPIEPMKIYEGKYHLKVTLDGKNWADFFEAPPGRKIEYKVKLNP